jgi:hypothetical protein
VPADEIVAGVQHLRASVTERQEDELLGFMDAADGGRPTEAGPPIASEIERLGRAQARDSTRPSSGAVTRRLLTSVIALG